jgi:glutamate synthase (NADPH/NADH) small chain
MGKITGFIEFDRELPPRRPVEERRQDYRDIYLELPVKKVKQQAARCMDCGVPFCQSGCPLGNIIPDWNDLVYRDRWEDAFRRLRATNNFPEFTGRICPAPCESACVLGINEPPVTIEQIEKNISDRGWSEGWYAPRPPAARTGREVAVVGSGPAGLAAADQLNQAGHSVTVFERDDRIGGLLRYGIPDFKLEKWIVDRRVEVMREEGIRFLTGAEVGKDYPVSRLDHFDAIVLTGGATKPRDLPLPGRDLTGVHFAWDYLWQQAKRNAGDRLNGIDPILATNKDVIVIGGGDTGSDCIGTANRQGARSITQFEVLPLPPNDRPTHQPWPFMPMVLSTTSSHEEGADRRWSILTKEFVGTGGRLQKLRTVNVATREDEAGRVHFDEMQGTERLWKADLVLLAIGYVGPEPDGVLAGLDVDLDPRGNVMTDDVYMTSRPGVFAAGDTRRGQSLVVWAIAEGREAARGVDAYLREAESALPTKGSGDLPRVR